MRRSLPYSIQRLSHIVRPHCQSLYLACLSHGHNLGWALIWITFQLGILVVFCVIGLICFKVRNLLE
jgi:hypothetical protein